MKKLFFTVTNDLNFDQRMHRICHTLAQNGYDITLVGRKLKTSIPLGQQSYHQKRLDCFCTKGFLFYAEFNIRLFFYLLGQKKMDAICAIDLDTILPCLLVARIKRTKKVYDAHELFTELKEVRTRPMVQRFWLAIERFCVPKFTSGYTVSNGLAEAFNKRYVVHYGVIRNVPTLNNRSSAQNTQPYILYQGAVNEARGLEYLVPAMQTVPMRLIICGDGNFMDALKQLIKKYGVTDKIELTGMISPEELRSITQNALLGINLVEREGLNQYYSLANKFFDYIHAGVPQVTMDFPEYKSINDQFGIAYLIPDLSVASVRAALLYGITNEQFQQSARIACLEARKILNWQQEEKKLIQFYKQILD